MPLLSIERGAERSQQDNFMTHTEDQLDAILENIKSGRQQQQLDSARGLANPSVPDVAPTWRQEADGTDELSVPVRGGYARAVYRRARGGRWVEVTDKPVPPTNLAPPQR